MGQEWYKQSKQVIKFFFDSSEFRQKLCKFYSHSTLLAWAVEALCKSVA